jgi:uncharacterized membrane protein YraQ (UPF0718 family)
VPPSDTSSSAIFSLEPVSVPRASWRETFNRVLSVVAHADPVLAALAALFVGLWAVNAVQGWITFVSVARELAHIAPWLAASVVIAAAARATGADAFAARAFTGREGRMIVAASLIGAVLPFCSCGVIPLVAGLLGAGVPLAPVMAFWISSPLMDPTQFFIAAGTIGVGFAAAKLVGAVGMGLLSGFGTMALVRMRWLDAPAALRLSPTAGKSSCSGSKPAPMPVAATSCCGSAKAPSMAVDESANCAPKPASTGSTVVWRFWTDPSRAQRFLTTAASTGWFLTRWLAVAYALESLMVAWLPVDTVATWLGAGAGLVAVPLAVAIGIPVYLNSFAAIPFVSGLIGLGMSPATGLAFMLASSATGSPCLVAVWALAKPRAFALYIGFAVLGALIVGYVYTAVLAATV